MRLVVLAAGIVLEIVAWRAVAAGRATIWRLMVGVFAVHGVAAAVVLPPVASGDAPLVTAVVAGAMSGVALWVATLAFVGVAVRWPPFHQAVTDRYARAAEVSLPVAVAISVLIAVPGEELFWRNLAQRRLGVSSEALGAAAAWLGYVAVNAASGSLPFVAGAIVGGAVWTGLAWWSGGVVAGLVSHAVWTAMMLVRPPVSGRAAVEAAPG
jgi:membrane protease YdiL (CAAX protease family)